MLRAIFSDAMFCGALFVQALAVLSMLSGVGGVALPEAFIPILASYHAKTAPIAAIGGSLFAGRAPVWFADAVLIGGVLFFLFFIRQARAAMAPYDDPRAASLPEAKGVEAAIDFFLPAAICAIGAITTAPLLLPFLTLPVALWLLFARLLGRPCWFAVSASYYVNIALLAGVAAAAPFAFAQ